VKIAEIQETKHHQYHRRATMNWYLSVLKNYAGFTGRARRREYWMFGLFNALFLIIAAVLDNIFGTTFEFLFYGLFYVLYSCAVLVPSLAVCVRRLHDVGKSGLFLFVGLIPLVGAIWLLILACKDGDPGTNAYGPNPKEVPQAIS